MPGSDSMGPESAKACDYNDNNKLIQQLYNSPEEWRLVGRDGLTYVWHFGDNMLAFCLSYCGRCRLQRVQTPLAKECWRDDRSL